MMTSILELTQQFLLKLNIFSTKSVNHEKVTCLINKLYPMDTEHKLVRVGSSESGGYLLPDLFEGIIACFSPGVGNDISFDLFISENYNIKSHLADGSVENPSTHPLHSFIKKFIAPKCNETCIDLDTWVSSHQYQNDLMLQMDIEGHEYVNILMCSEALLDSFRIIVLELHDLDHAFTKTGYNILEAFIDKITKNHTVVHAHPNNCRRLVKCGLHSFPPVLEITLLRNDQITYFGGPATLPHPHDIDCCKTKKSILWEYSDTKIRKNNSDS